MITDETFSRLRNHAEKRKLTPQKLMDKLLNWKLDDLDWFDVMIECSKKAGFEIKLYCCRNKPKYAVIYNTTSGFKEESYLVCEEHFREDCFSRGIKKMVKL